MTSQPTPVPPDERTVRVSVIVRDNRGFTHYYEEIDSTPGAIRDAYDLMARHRPLRVDSPHLGSHHQRGAVVHGAVDRRYNDLVRLLEGRPTVRNAIAQVRSSMDVAAPSPVVLHVRHVEWLIALYRSGDIPGEELEQWASTVRSVSDISFDAQYRDVLSQALFELSTPELFGEMPEIVASLSARFDPGT